MEKKNISAIKRQWRRANRLKICAIVFTVMALFVCAVVFHKVSLVITGIVVGSFAFFYFRNKLAAYVEARMYS